MGKRDELTEQELAAAEATQLPDREVMSIISADPTISPDGALLGGYDGGTDTGTAATPAGGTADHAEAGTGAAGGASQDASGLVAADASATESEATPVEGDRHEVISSSDSASATS